MGRTGLDSDCEIFADKHWAQRMSRFWSSLVHELHPYAPGEQPRLAGLVKLNTNESPL